MQSRSRELLLQYPTKLSCLGILALIISSCGSAPYFPVSAPVSSLHAVSSTPSPSAEYRQSTFIEVNRGITASSHSASSESLEISSSSDSQYDDIQNRLDEQERYQRERDEKEDEYRARAEEREREREQRRRDRDRDREREQKRHKAERKEEFLRKNKSDLQEALKKKFGK